MSWVWREKEELLNAMELLEHSVTSEDALILIKKIEKETRAEFGVDPRKFFSKSDVVQRLINIGKQYASDEKALEKVIAALVTISERCDIKPQNIYDFLFDYIDSPNKKIKMSVANALPFFPQFNSYEKKWEYILSIPKLTPKRDSMDVFRWVIQYKIADVPHELKSTIIDIFKNVLKKRDQDLDIFHSVHLFEDLIERLSK